MREKLFVIKYSSGFRQSFNVRCLAFVIHGFPIGKPTHSSFILHHKSWRHYIYDIKLHFLLRTKYSRTFYVLSWIRFFCKMRWIRKPPGCVNKGCLYTITGRINSCQHTNRTVILPHRVSKQKQVFAEPTGLFNMSRIRFRKRCFLCSRQNKKCAKELLQSVNKKPKALRWHWCKRALEVKWLNQIKHCFLYCETFTQTKNDLT